MNEIKYSNLSEWWVYPLSSPTCTNMCIIGMHDLSAILPGNPCQTLSYGKLQILNTFTSMVYSALEVDPISDDIYIGISRGDSILWEFMNTCCSKQLFAKRGINESDCPCIVWSKPLNRLFRIDYTLPFSPSNWIVHETPDGSSQTTSSTLSMCAQKYNIASIDPDQPILVSSTKSVITCKPLLDHVKNRQTGNNAPEQFRMVYLVSEMVTLHPFNSIQSELSEFSRNSNWFQSAMVCAELFSSMVLLANNTCLYKEFAVKFIPLGFKRYSGIFLTLMHVSLVCPGALLTYNNQKLEWIGDAVWRLLVALAGIANNDIRQYFSTLLSNERIGKMALIHFPDLRSKIFSDGPYRRTVNENNTKTIANVTEAIIGVSWLCGGLESAFYTANKLGLFQLDDLKVKSGIPDPLPGKTESYFNRAVACAFVSLRVSLTLMMQFPHETIGQLDLKRQTGIKQINGPVYDPSQLAKTFKQWDHELLLGMV